MLYELLAEDAQQIATWIWENEPYKIFKTTHMAELVGDLLEIRIKAAKNLYLNIKTPSPKTLRKWISVVAPDFAKIGGSPTKEEKKEIRELKILLLTAK